MKKFKTIKEAYDEQKKREYNEYLYSQLNPDEQERYTIIDGLEGPIKLKSGKIVYYDPSDGQYYDRDTDMYIPADEIQLHSEQNEEERYGNYLIRLVQKIKEQDAPEAISTLGEFGQIMKQHGYDSAKSDFGVGEYKTLEGDRI